MALFFTYPLVTPLPIQERHMFWINTSSDFVRFFNFMFPQIGCDDSDLIIPKGVGVSEDEQVTSLYFLCSIAAPACQYRSPQPPPWAYPHPPLFML